MPGRPNVVLFVPDQLRADALGCFGNAVCHTPNVDALANRGVTPELVGTAIALRTPRSTFVYRACEGDEIYDRIADPAETTNLAHVPELAPGVSDLRVRVLDWLAETSDVIPWTPDPRFPDLVHGYREP